MKTNNWKQLKLISAILFLNFLTVNFVKTQDLPDDMGFFIGKPSVESLSAKTSLLASIDTTDLSQIDKWIR